MTSRLRSTTSGLGNRRDFLASTVCASIVATSNSRAIAAGKLAAGSTLTFTFPSLPETLFTKGPFSEGRRVVPTLTARLPDDFTPDRKFPLFVYLEGGDGLTGTSTASAEKCVGPRGFICVSLPLFKRSRSHNEMYFGVLPTADDFAHASAAFRSMLTRLIARVPNITPERSTLGGWSNGGHFTALLVAGQDDFILRTFTQFFYGDGGFTLLAGNCLHKPAVRRARHLLLLADPMLTTRPTTDQTLPDFDHRPALRQIADAVTTLARGYGADFEQLVMKGQPHGFTLPPAYFELIGRWARGEALANDTRTTNYPDP